MSDWLFDLGNTRLKFAPREGFSGAAPGHLVHRGDPAAFRLPPEVQGSTAWVAAVVPPALQAGLRDALLERFRRISFARTLSRSGRLRIAYARPESLGVDRFLAMRALAGEGRATLLAGVGTALTVDLVDADGRHRGGRIAPSPTLMRECLHQRAPHLPLRGGEALAFAADTADALASGCEGAALALLRESLQAAERLLGGSVAMVLHGGGADALLPQLAEAQLRPALIMEGLSGWAGVADRA